MAACTIPVYAQNKQAKKPAVKVPAAKNISKEKGTAFFSTTKTDLKSIDEANGTVSTVFRFTNIGKGPLTIKEVNASCRCTAPEWTQTPVKTGDSGFVKVTFNPAKLSGAFERTMTVVTDGDPQVTYLTITGSVNGETAEIIEKYPRMQGSLRFTTYDINFGRVYKDGSDSTGIVIYNPTDKQIQIKGIKTPPHIRITTKFRSIEPKSILPVSIQYYGNVPDDYGYRVDECLIRTSDDSIPDKVILVTSSLEENFSKLTPDQLKKAPSIQFTTPEIDLGEIKVKSVHTVVYEFVNKGKSDLMIREVSAGCGCTVVNIDNKVVKKGKKGTITVRYSTQSDYDLVNRTVTVITNDPKNTTQTLVLKAKIVL